MAESKVRSRPPIDWSAWLVWLLLAAIIAIAVWLMVLEPAPLATETAEVAVPKDDWPAYSFLTAADLVTKTLPMAGVSSETVTNTATLSGAISLVPLAVSQPITVSQVVRITDPSLISDTVVIAIEGGAALAFGGQLRSGAIVSAWAGERQILDRLLVLDVKRFETDRKLEPLPPRYVVILALPPDQRNTVMTAAANGTLSFSLAP